MKRNDRQKREKPAIQHGFQRRALAAPRGLGRFSVIVQGHPAHQTHQQRDNTRQQHGAAVAYQARQPPGQKSAQRAAQRKCGKGNTEHRHPFAVVGAALVHDLHLGYLDHRHADGHKDHRQKQQRYRAKHIQNQVGADQQHTARIHVFAAGSACQKAQRQRAQPHDHNSGACNRTDLRGGQPQREEKQVQDKPVHAHRRTVDSLGPDINQGLPAEALHCKYLLGAQNYSGAAISR